MKNGHLSHSRKVLLLKSTEAVAALIDYNKRDDKDCMCDENFDKDWIQCHDYDDWPQICI